MASYTLDWSRQRQEAMDREDVIQSPFTQIPVPPPLSLRLLGEKRIWRPVLYMRVPTDRVELTRLKRLFPEAVVVEEQSWGQLNAMIDAWTAKMDASSKEYDAAIEAAVAGKSPGPATDP